MSSGAEEGTILVSGGEDVKYWSVPRLEQVGCKSFGANINSVCWSPSSLFLAVALETSGISIVGQKDNYDSFTLPTKAEQNSVNVSDNSRYVLTGGKDTVVSIWDLKHKSVKKSFKAHKDEIQATCFNRGFTAIASGDASGDIYVHNIVTDAAEGPLHGDGTQAIRGLQYSFFRKHVLASVSDDAVLNLWDTNTKQVLKAFSSEHRAPASDLSFSPVNDMLLASVGLDKRLVFYDVVGRKSVKTINAESPLVSVEFYNDGATIAAGAASGKIFVFDLRSGSTPIRVTQAHRTSVRCMAFQRAAKSTDKATSRKSGETKNNLTRNKEHTPVQTSTQAVEVEPKVKAPQKSKTTATVSPQTPSRINGDVFSPLKDDSIKDVSGTTPNKSDVSVPMSTEKAPETTPVKVPERPELGRRGISDLSVYTKTNGNRNRLSSSGSDTVTATPGDAYSSEVFSPFRKTSGENVSPSSSVKISGSNFSPKLTSVNDFGVRAIRDNRRASASADVVSSTASTLNDTPKHHVSDTKKGVVRPESSKKSPKELRPHSVSSLLAEVGLKAATSVAKPVGGDENRLYSSMPPKGALATQSTPDLNIIKEDRLVARTVNTIESIDSLQPVEATEYTEKGPVLHPFQIDFIRNMIEDAMEESRTSIHHDLINLQIEVLRQLQIQQDEIKRVVQQYSINEDLVKENERLREEIKNLKTKY